MEEVPWSPLGSHTPVQASPWPRQEAESHSTDEPPSCPDDCSCSELPSQERHQEFTLLKTRMSHHSFCMPSGSRATGKVFFLSRYVKLTL